MLLSKVELTPRPTADHLVVLVSRSYNLAAVLQRGDGMHLGILASVIFLSTIVLTPSAVAQERERQQSLSANEVSPQQELRAGIPEPSSPSMSQMMKGRTSTEFYPTLLRISEPDPVERRRLERRQAVDVRRHLSAF